MRYLTSAFAGTIGPSLWSLLLVLSPPLASTARADDEPVAVHHVAPPPAPDEHPATLGVEVHGAMAVPLFRDAMCPSNAACVLGLGVGVGVQIERRSSDRVGLFAGYDFWLLDSNGVFELGALHAIRGGVRYVFDDQWIVHPFAFASIGLLAFGDTADVKTVGGVIAAGGGAELELSESVLFVASFEGWMFATAPFTTRDSIDRARDFGVNLALEITIGISVLVGPTVTPQ